MEFAKGVCNKATDRGHWADYIDPCSGLPVSRCPVAWCLSSGTLYAAPSVLLVAYVVLC